MRATPTWSDELAQHSKAVWYARGGKFGGSAAEQRAITWGDPVAVRGPEVSRGHSSWRNEPECEVAQQSCRRIAFGHAEWLRSNVCAIAQGRSPNEGLNCHGNVLTAWRTVNPPMTPDGEVEPRAAAMGSMWAFRSRLRLVPYAGLSRVRAEPPCTMPLAL
jgi:hypothetical protein